MADDFFVRFYSRHVHPVILVSNPEHTPASALLLLLCSSVLWNRSFWKYFSSFWFREVICQKDIMKLKHNFFYSTPLTFLFVRTAFAFAGNRIFTLTITLWPPTIIHQAMDSTRTLKMCCGIWQQATVTDISIPLHCEVGPPWIGLAFPADPTDAWFDRDLEKLQAKSTSHICATTPEFLRLGCPLPLLHGPDMMPIVGTFGFGHRSASDLWLRFLSIGTRIKVFSNLSYSSSIGSSYEGHPSLPTCFNELWPTITLLWVRQSFVLEPLLVGPDLEDWEHPKRAAALELLWPGCLTITSWPFSVAQILKKMASKC